MIGNLTGGGYKVWIQFCFGRSELSDSLLSCGYSDHTFVDHHAREVSGRDWRVKIAKRIPGFVWRKGGNFIGDNLTKVRGPLSSLLNGLL
jgi:hypothetical protein